MGTCCFRSPFRIGALKLKRSYLATGLFHEVTMWTARRTTLLIPALLVALATGGLAADDAVGLLERIRNVGKEGTGNSEAGKAWRQLAQLGPDMLPDVLAALDEATPTAANWLRTAVDAIAERALETKQRLPAARLEAFIKEVRHAGPARRLAYEWLTRVDSAAPDRLLPGMLDDPGAELRRDAVAWHLREVLLRKDKASREAGLQKLFASARDRDQVEEIAKTLKDLGAPVDLTAHFGFITRWLLIGPFDNTGSAGFARVFPPEQGVDPAATLPGKKSLPLRWIEHRTSDPYGMVDLNKAIGKHMGAIGYAFAVVTSPQERPIEIRAGSNNAVKLFLNGKQIFFRDEYHHGLRMDQHVGFGSLRAGRNEILIKVCQNEQKDDWAQLWSFQLRVCDALGGAVPLSLVTAAAPSTQAKDRP
jgi:hypothetical protein